MYKGAGTKLFYIGEKKEGTGWESSWSRIGRRRWSREENFNRGLLFNMTKTVNTKYYIETDLLPTKLTRITVPTASA